jgi:O-antigen/teichoic acid export membrane protein
MGGAGVYILGYFFTLEVVAVYSLGYKLAWILIIAIIAPFQLAFQPFVYNSFEKVDFNEKLTTIITYLVLAITITIFSVLFASRLLLPLIAPPEYSSAFLVILFLLPGTAFVGIYYIGETLLSAVKKTHLVGLMMTCIAAAALLINYLLIPIMNWYGAVIASNICFMVAGVTFLTLGKRYFIIPLEWRRIGMCVAILSLFFILFLALRDTAPIFFIVCSTGAALFSLALLFKLSFFNPGELTLIKRTLIPLN